jgi:hypothetical protein
VANQGVGIWCHDQASPVITNTIVWDNSGAEILVQSGSPSVSYCDVKGGFPGTGNIDLDPLFRDPARGDFTLTSVSPCVDAGDPGYRPCAADLEQNPRVLDGRLARLPRVDTGALEFNNIHLEAREAPKSFDIAFPGRERRVIITTTGTPGLSTTLWIGLGQGTVCDPLYGTLFLDFTKPWARLPWGTVPSVVTVTVPAEIPPGTPLVFQELGLDPSQAGNFSNFVPLVVGR